MVENISEARSRGNYDTRRNGQREGKGTEEKRNEAKRREKRIR